MKEIQLTQGQVALVDDRDYAWLSKHKWFAQWKRYGYIAGRQVRGKLISMGVAIMKPAYNMQVDHINGITLDYQRANIRVVTTSQNAWNRGGRHRATSRFKGVSLHTTNDNWIVHITKNGRTKHIGCFDSEGEAARAYDTAAKELYGEFAFLNFPTIGDE